MLLRRRRPAALFTQESDFAVVKPFKPRPMSSMNHHRIGQKITHVLHQSELAELVER